MSAPDVRLVGRGEPWQEVMLPAPDEHVDLGSVEPGEIAPLWRLRGAVFADLGTWVRAASASAPMEIAGHDELDDVGLDDLEHDLLALLAAVRASRTAGGARVSAGLPTREEMLRRALDALDTADRGLSDGRDWLNADWRPVGSELTDEQAAARSAARAAIAKAKRELTPARDALLRAGRAGDR